MDTSLIRSFIVLAETGSYHEAANRLFITQSALTKQINKLEENLKVILFERGRHGARLTSSGQFLLKYALELVKKEQEFKTIASNAAMGYAGHLNIGFGLSTMYIAAKMISDFKCQYTDIAISLNDMASSEQVRLLLSGELSVGFARLPVSDQLHYKILLTDNLTLVTNNYVDSLSSAFEILKNSPYLCLTENKCPGLGLGLNFQIRQFVNYHNLNLNLVQEADDIQTLLALVSAGIGVTLLPQSAKFLGIDNIQIIPLSGEFTQWQVGVVWNPKVTDPVRDRFLSMI